MRNQVMSCNHSSAPQSHAELSAQINLLVLVYKISSKVLKRSHRDISISFLALDHYPRGRTPIQVVEANMCNMLYICWIPYFHLLLLVHCKRIITESTPIRTHQILTVIICYGDRNRTKKIKGVNKSSTKYMRDVFDSLEKPLHLDCHCTEALQNMHLTIRIWKQTRLIMQFIANVDWQGKPRKHTFNLWLQSQKLYSHPSFSLKFPKMMGFQTSKYPRKMKEQKRIGFGF